ncbi:MAG: acetate kinase [Oscillospiraceae bacterium]|jgi:acetate kinase|nr:acetate kinase [Oscillospiraceae bacterium]
MKILIINAGSSSLKYQLMDMDTETLIAKGICERIGTGEVGMLKHTPKNGKPEYMLDAVIADHDQAIGLVLGALVSPDHGVVSSLSEVGAVGHRVLNGGPKFETSVLINSDVIKSIEEFIPLGPLHNPANLKGIEACQKAMPGTPQVATFDTSFHQTMPDYAYIYAIPYEYYEKYNIRRYGFHGTSHRYVSEEAVRLLGGRAAGTKIITCHCGNGSSIAALRDGRCVDTSMGLTPLEGVPMGTRSGSIDPAIAEFLANSEGLTRKETYDILNKKSGVLGVSGVSSDFRSIEAAAADAAHPLQRRAQLALDIFYYDVAKYVAAYAGILGGADAIVFTAGLGENSPELREAVIGKLSAAFGVYVDPQKNFTRGTVDITGDASKTKVFVIPTNEELVIARDTKEIVEKL